MSDRKAGWYWFTPQRRKADGSVVRREADQVIDYDPSMVEPFGVFGERIPSSAELKQQRELLEACGPLELELVAGHLEAERFGQDADYIREIAGLARAIREQA